MFKKVILELTKTIFSLYFFLSFILRNFAKQVDNYLFNYWKTGEIIRINIKEPLTKENKKNLKTNWEVQKYYIIIRLTASAAFLVAFEIFRFFYKRHKKNEKFDKEMEELIKKDGFERPKQSNRKN